MKKATHPSWIKEKEECCFCEKKSKISDIELINRDGQEIVKVSYKCTNPKCKYLKFGNGLSTFTMLYIGSYPSRYKEFLDKDKSLDLLGYDTGVKP